MNFEVILPRLPFILKGVIVTLEYTLVSVFFGFILGAVFALMKLSSKKWLQMLAQAYVSVFRGTPLIVQLSIVYFATPQLFGYTITPYEAGILTFSCNSAAYITEIIRGGILSVDKGQFEAAEALALSYRVKMVHIILPQAIRNILPALVNEAISLLKETALVSIIAENDLLRRANIISAETYLFFEPLLVVAVIYYCLILILTQVSGVLERKLKIK